MKDSELRAFQILETAIKSGIIAHLRVDSGAQIATELIDFYKGIEAGLAEPYADKPSLGMDKRIDLMSPYLTGVCYLCGLTHSDDSTCPAARVERACAP